MWTVRIATRWLVVPLSALSIIPMVFLPCIRNANPVSYELRVVHCVILIPIDVVVDIKLSVFMIRGYQMHASDDVCQVVESASLQASGVFALR